MDFASQKCTNEFSLSRIHRQLEVSAVECPSIKRVFNLRPPIYILATIMHFCIGCFKESLLISFIQLGFCCSFRNENQIFHSNLHFPRAFVLKHFEQEQEYKAIKLQKKETQEKERNNHVKKVLCFFSCHVKSI